jgi:hypothetical protein
MVINESSTRVLPFDRSIQNDFSLVYHSKMIFHKVFKKRGRDFLYEVFKHKILFMLCSIYTSQTIKGSIELVIFQEFGNGGLGLSIYYYSTKTTRLNFS